MEKIIFPELICPFQSTLNPNVVSVNRHTIEWVQRFNLVSGDRALERFKAARFAWLAARAYPTAPLQELLIVAEWNIWLFIHDDECDEAGIGRQPERLAQVYERLRSIFEGAPPAVRDTPLAHALHELWQRMRRNSSLEWRARFLKSVEDYFAACLWEAENRAADRVPDMETYVRLRPLTGALNTDFELIEPCEHIYLPLEVYQDPTLQQLALLCNNVVCWSNDIFSLEKERRTDNRHNLVIIVQNEWKCSWQEAVDAVAAMHNAEVRKFLHLASQLPSFGPEVDGELARFVAILRSWMRGNFDWAFDTGRYGVSAAQELENRACA